VLELLCCTTDLATPPNPQFQPESSQDSVVLSPSPAREPAWGIFDVLALGVGTFLVINVVAAMLLVPLAAAQHITGELPLPLVAKAVIPAEVIAYVLLIVITKLVLSMRGHPRLMKAVQWNWPPLKVTASLALLGIGCAVGIVEAGSLFNIPPDLPIEEMMKDRFVANMFLIFGILPAPFVEELYFRGLLYPALERKIGNAAAIVLTAAAFAGMHATQLAGSVAPLAMLFVVGLILTIIRAVTGSVGTAFIFHVAYNSALFLLDALAK
jgi:membrane protease YdiL (CAAX protease family)